MLVTRSAAAVILLGEAVSRFLPAIHRMKSWRSQRTETGRFPPESEMRAFHKDLIPARNAVTRTDGLLQTVSIGPGQTRLDNFIDIVIQTCMTLAIPLEGMQNASVNDIRAARQKLRKDKSGLFVAMCKGASMLGAGASIASGYATATTASWTGIPAAIVPLVTNCATGVATHDDRE